MVAGLAPSPSGLPETVIQQWQSQIDFLRRQHRIMICRLSLFLISRLLARQVPIAAGTDTPIGLGIPGYSLHTELELVAGGMTNQQAACCNHCTDKILL